MISVPFELANDNQNPLDLVEELAEHKGWTFTRIDDEGMNMVITGQKAKYDVAMEWQEEFSSLLIACSLPLPIDAAHYEMTVQALEKINKNIWLGHFDLSNQDKFPTFRHTLLLRMIPAAIAVELIEDVFDIVIAECNRFYSTFERAKEGDIRLHDDLTAAVFETVGEA
jgi:hypothetical protein